MTAGSCDVIRGQDDAPDGKLTVLRDAGRVNGKL